MDSSASGMASLGPVVVATDGSEGAARAVRWAAGEAASRSQPLTIVHAGDLGADVDSIDSAAVQRIRDTGRRLLDDAAARVSEQFPDLSVTTTLSESEVTGSVLDATPADGTIVVGPPGRGRFAELLLGSVGLTVAGRAQGPVIVVRGSTEAAPRPRRVVLAAVRDDLDLDVLHFAAKTAQNRKASLRVLKAWLFLQSVGSVAPMLDDLSGIAKTEAVATSCFAESIRTEFPDLMVTEDTVRATSVAGALVEESLHADLLVIGARRRALALGSPLGRVTDAILHHSRCPVAIVPRNDRRPHRPPRPPSDC
ncbi:universal stress protein [Streptomyces sp. NPDC085929]|uniref:universal stress protein n=1 Tax=Streptomyces sp. NPDC085929 TaxID=3365739 RepID=UPI0037CD78C1